MHLCTVSCQTPPKSFTSIFQIALSLPKAMYLIHHKPPNQSGRVDVEHCTREEDKALSLHAVLPFVVQCSPQIYISALRLAPVACYKLMSIFSISKYLVFLFELVSYPHPHSLDSNQNGFHWLLKSFCTQSP